MDVPAVICLRRSDTEEASIVDTKYSSSGTSILLLEILNNTVIFSRCRNLGEGETFTVDCEQAVKMAKLILHNEQERQAREERERLVASEMGEG